jgi:hypothetical protein
MDVAIIPNFMTCCMMLHNLLNFQEELKTKNILSLEEESMIKKRKTIVRTIMDMCKIETSVNTRN